MTTLVNVQSRIADDLNRTDLTSQIQQQIIQAIRHYRRFPFWFNEASTTLTASNSASSISVPSDFLELESLYISISGYPIQMVQKPIEEIVEYRPANGSRPTAFCYWQDRFELDFEVDQQYEFPCYYIKDLAEPSISSDETAWLTYGEDMIVYRAEKMLYANVIKDRAAAATAGALEGEAFRNLMGFRDQRVGTGQNKAWGY